MTADVEALLALARRGAQDVDQLREVRSPLSPLFFVPPLCAAMRRRHENRCRQHLTTDN